MNKYCFLGNYTESDEILVTMERYQEYYQDALDGIAQMEKTKALILESKSLNNRELRLVQQGAMGWANYLELPPKMRPSLEMRAGYTNKELALETVNAVHGGLFAVALAILAWVISAIVRLFKGEGGGGSSGGGGGGGSACGISENKIKTVKETLEVAKKKGTTDLVREKNSDAVEEIASAGLKLLGIKGNVVKLEDLRRISSSLYKVATIFSRVTDALNPRLREFTRDLQNRKFENFESWQKYFNTFFPEAVPELESIPPSDNQGYGVPDSAKGRKMEIIPDVLAIVIDMRDEDNATHFVSRLFRYNLDFEPCSSLEIRDVTLSQIEDEVKDILNNTDKAVKKTAKHMEALAELYKRLEETIAKDFKGKEDVFPKGEEETLKAVIGSAVSVAQVYTLFIGRLNTAITGLNLAMIDAMLKPL